jgi:hypothetical protein
MVYLLHNDARHTAVVKAAMAGDPERKNYPGQ